MTPTPCLPEVRGDGMNLTEWMLANLPGEVIADNESRLIDAIDTALCIAFNQGVRQAAEVGTDAAFLRNPYFRGEPA